MNLKKKRSLKNCDMYKMQFMLSTKYIFSNLIENNHCTILIQLFIYQQNMMLCWGIRRNVLPFNLTIVFRPGSCNDYKSVACRSVPWLDVLSDTAPTYFSFSNLVFYFSLFWFVCDYHYLHLC